MLSRSLSAVSLLVVPPELVFLTGVLHSSFATFVSAPKLVLTFIGNHQICLFIVREVAQS